MGMDFHSLIALGGGHSGRLETFLYIELYRWAFEGFRIVHTPGNDAKIYRFLPSGTLLRDTDPHKIKEFTLKLF
jgi:hypothetical protein